MVRASVAVAVALSLLLVAASAGASPVARLFAAGLPAQGAVNLVLNGPVIVELVDADAAFNRLPANDFIGLRQAYYAYDVASSTYWAAAEVVPSTSAYQAQVASQDDGGYTVFHKAAHAAWVASDDGMAGAGGSTCAAYHVRVPAAVAAAWHWGAGTCKPSGSTSGPLLLTYFAKASQEWWGGASSASAGQAGFWLRASQDLEAAVAAKATGTYGYANSAHELLQLSKLPDAMLTPAQQEALGALTADLDSFFGTNGLYGDSAPSPTPKAFVTTLQQETDLGTLGDNVVADPRLGQVPSTFTDTTVTCP